MLYYLVELRDQIGPFNVFQYITLRTGGAIMTAMFFVFLFGPGLINLLRVKQGRGQPIREDGPQSHIIQKQGTPTMGGLMILAGITVSTLLWANLSNQFVWIVLFVMLGYGAIGFYDDYLKVSKQTHHGFSSKMRLGLEFLIAGIATFWIVQMGNGDSAWSVAIPMWKDGWIYLSWFFIIFGMFVISGAGNAVNLTDGLDGLAIGPVMIAAATFGLIAYLAGNIQFSTYLKIQYVPGTGELAVICGAIIGAGLGFLWFNAPPAMIFMGDTGSLALGGALGAIAIASKHSLVLAIVGGLFVLEAVSVIVQVLSFKLTGKRVFRMAPIHHHFEQKGWKEPTIVIRFWIIAIVLSMIALATLKLR